MKSPKIKKYIALIHVAKNTLNLSDEEYRSLLAHEGISSCSEITTDEKALAVYALFNKLGFTPSKKHQQRSHFKHHRKGSPSRLTARQEYYIRGLWNLCMRNSTSEKSLNVFCERTTGVPYVHWLTVSEASTLINALRKIAEKKGFNPDHPE